MSFDVKKATALSALAVSTLLSGCATRFGPDDGKITIALGDVERFSRVVQANHRVVLVPSGYVDRFPSTDNAPSQEIQSADCSIHQTFSQTGADGESIGGDVEGLGCSYECAKSFAGNIIQDHNPDTYAYMGDSSQDQEASHGQSAFPRNSYPGDPDQDQIVGDPGYETFTADSQAAVVSDNAFIERQLEVVRAVHEFEMASFQDDFNVSLVNTVARHQGFEALRCHETALVYNFIRNEFHVESGFVSQAHCPDTAIYEHSEEYDFRFSEDGGCEASVKPPENMAPGTSFSAALQTVPVDLCDAYAPQPGQ